MLTGFVCGICYSHLLKENFMRNDLSEGKGREI